MTQEKGHNPPCFRGRTKLSWGSSSAKRGHFATSSLCRERLSLYLAPVKATPHQAAARQAWGRPPSGRPRGHGALFPAGTCIFPEELASPGPPGDQPQDQCWREPSQPCGPRTKSPSRGLWGSGVAAPPRPGLTGSLPPSQQGRKRHKVSTWQNVTAGHTVPSRPVPDTTLSTCLPLSQFQKTQGCLH